MSYDHELNDDEKRELLRIARATLREFLRSGRIPPGKPHRDSLVADAGAFVTLQHRGELRGCIGHVEARQPIYKAIQEMAVAAASRDPRFPPITADELDQIDIEVSVLGSHAPVSSPGEVIVGTHGLAIDMRDRRGLLLPQVAVEHGWDAAAFLQHLCHKADLPADAWRDPDARVERFSAQVFSDTTHPPARLLRRT